MDQERKFAVLADIHASKIVAVVRLADASQVIPVADALILGGIRCIEITMTVPDATDTIQQLADRYGIGITLGAGTVLDIPTADKVLAAGADFIVSPVMIPELITHCKSRGVVVIPGCFTPSEIFNAWKLGADIIKVFPAGVLGMKYLRDIHGPFPDIPLMPTGGVTLVNAGAWLDAGACAVGIGTDLLDPDIIRSGDFPALTALARILAAKANAAGVNK